MPDYISREAAAQILRKEAANHYPTPFHVGLLAAARVIEAIPSADVRPVVKAEWVRCGDGENTPYMCSHCGKTSPANLIEKWTPNFCPNCGADMRIFSTNCKNTVTTGEESVRDGK